MRLEYCEREEKQQTKKNEKREIVEIGAQELSPGARASQVLGTKKEKEKKNRRKRERKREGEGEEKEETNTNSHTGCCLCPRLDDCLACLA